MDRVILHVDMDAYFASVEQKASPALRGKPVVVVGDLKRRSVVMTASYEARAHGIRTGSLLHEARRLCPWVVPVLGDPRKYLAQTRALRTVFETFSPFVEVASVDEAYIDVTGSLALLRVDAEGAARLLQARVRSELDLPCSVGAAPNKLLAKLGSGLRKPMGVSVIRPSEVAELLRALPVGELCGVGPNLRRRLAELGIRTCGQLGAAPLDLLQAEFGIWGWWLGRWGRGEDDAPVRCTDAEEEIKSVGHSTTLPGDTEDPELIASYMLLLSEKVAARLRRHGRAGRTVSATVRTDDFVTLTRSRTLGEPLCDGPALCRVALSILAEVAVARPVRLLGVCVSGLERFEEAPYLLERLERGRCAARAMDEVNSVFGKRTVRRAAELAAERFGLLEPPIPPRMLG